MTSAHCVFITHTPGHLEETIRACRNLAKMKITLYNTVPYIHSIMLSDPRQKAMQTLTWTNILRNNCAAICAGPVFQCVKTCGSVSPLYRPVWHGANKQQATWSHAWTLCLRICHDSLGLLSRKIWQFQKEQQIWKDILCKVLLEPHGTVHASFKKVSFKIVVLKSILSCILNNRIIFWSEQKHSWSVVTNNASKWANVQYIQDLTALSVPL